MEKHINRFWEMIEESSNIVFFGGAGTSTESGVKDYRSKDGIYNTVKEFNVPPEIILSHDFFFENPETFYDFYRKYFIIEADPNDAHKALAELEGKGKLKAVITQNIDRLHQKAGSKNVIELHGSGAHFYCSKCYENGCTDGIIDTIKAGQIPKCAKCGGVMKPRVVLYGEMLFDGVAENAIAHIEKADMLIIGGTSLAVYPAASFINYFRGKYLVIINKSSTDHDNRADLVITESIGKVFGEIRKKL